MKKQLKLQNGSVIAYEENGSGKPVVLIHGFTGNTTSWADTLESLGKDHHVYAYDLIGHGETVVEDTGAVSDMALADQLHDFLEGLNLTDVLVVAHSLGGDVLFQYVMKYGCQYWRGAIVADMTPAMNPAEDWDLIAAGGFGSRSALEEMKTDYNGYMTKFFAAGVPQLDTPDDEYQAMAEGWIAQFEPELATKVLESCQADYRPALSLFTVPTAYFYADPGSILPNPDKIADCYREKITAAPFTAVPFNCETHFFPEALNEEFVEKVIAFEQTL